MTAKEIIEMNLDVRRELEQFVKTELDNGLSFEDLLEMFDVTPEEAFVDLFLCGKIDEEKLDSYIREVE